LQSRLKIYLEIESILNRFFNRFGYCTEQCTEIQSAPNAPSPACCKGKYYKLFDVEHPAFALLKAEREKRYGAPGDYSYLKRISPCEYHTLSGCRLKTHKSPVCLGFMCRESIEFLRSRFCIFEYDYLGVYYALEWILTGDLAGKPLADFKALCLSMLQKLDPSSVQNIQ
jgi:hypothetical protein